MAAKKRGERSGKGGGTPQGVARSPDTVAASEHPVKSDLPKVPTRREQLAAWRLRVAKARAREQAAKDRAERKAVVKRLEAEHAAVKVAAESALAEAKAVRAATVTTTEKEAYKANEALQRAEFEARFARAPIQPEQYELAIKTIKTGRELLEERIAHYYVKAKVEGLIDPISPKHDTGKTWRHVAVAREGIIVDRFVGRFLREGTIEDTTRRLVRAARKAKRLEPRGRLYVSFSLVEYGRGVPKSPGPELFRDAIGSFRQGYDGTAGLVPASDIAGFESQVRTILEQRLRTSGSSNAVLIDSFQVKSFVERPREEHGAFIKERRARKRKKKADEAKKDREEDQ